MKYIFISIILYSCSKGETCYTCQTSSKNAPIQEICPNSSKYSLAKISAESNTKVSDQFGFELKCAY